MVQARGIGIRQQKEYDALELCHGLFQEWLVDLTQEEKEIWLWNAMVSMAKIKQKKKAFKSN